MKKLLLVILIIATSGSNAFPNNEPLLGKDVTGKLERLMAKGNIPGLSLVIVKGNQVMIRSFGYADAGTKQKVTPQTIFEIGSCTKAFTALAALQLEKEGRLDLNAPVSKYLPWLTVRYKEKVQAITLNQLLHHTSGIPFKTIASIPEDAGNNALENTVRTLIGVELANLPGTVYEYATINYDVVGLVIQQVTHMPYERYMEAQVFLPLGLKNTFFDRKSNEQTTATGYKIGFFAPRKYEAPVFRGNYPAGYISTTAEDMARWLAIQMGVIHTAFDSLIDQSHLPDLSVAPQGVSSYAYGWTVDPYGNGKISHPGLNPNFTSEIEFYRSGGVGVSVMANSNSAYTPVIADVVLQALSGVPYKETNAGTDNIDRICSLLSMLMAGYVLFMLALVFLKLRKIVQKRGLLQLTGQKVKKAGMVLLFVLPYLAGIYLIPRALVGFTWQSIFVWTPVSFACLVVLLVAAIVVSTIFYFLTLFTESRKRYKDKVPAILLLSIISGLANTIVLFIITTSFYTTISYYYLLFYFALAYGLYVVCTKVAQAGLIQLTNDITFDIRAWLINKLIKVPYRKFEKIEDGQIVNILNSDTTVIANSAQVYVNFISNLVTIFSAFAYLFTISMMATLIVFVLIVLLAWYYYFLANKARVYLEEARTTMNRYTGLINGLTRGFNLLSIHAAKKSEYRSEMIDVSDQYRQTNVFASFKFLNGMIIGNSFIMIVLGMLSIVVPHLTSQISVFTIISFVMVLLYIIGPINLVLGSVQQIGAVNVAWGRIAGFIQEMEPAATGKLTFWKLMDHINAIDVPQDNSSNMPLQEVRKISIEGVTFSYKQETTDASFTLGPLDLTIEGGETVFVIGGNGSGKSTFMNLLTGLYTPDEGEIKINGLPVEARQLGEYFSVVFSGNHIFQKLYGISLNDREEEGDALVRRVQLENKVSIGDNSFSTIELSGGQRKRLALLAAYLDDRPIFLLDEFAADQDPGFRKYFYRELLPGLKALGKTIIAVTHDDHYFDVADKVIKLDYGRLEAVYDGKLVVEEKAI